MQQPPRQKTSRLFLGCALVVGALTLCGIMLSIGKAATGTIDTSTPTPTATLIAMSQDTAQVSPTSQIGVCGS